ncbi:radical SAM/SPASM domain-containing protein [Paenibacillus oleatilyticus]|uniref:radical SAM/SPASM domain-containing protein n=1 Tax=Paenibacillus oleatilyticus TaxID=2594886 RepID=UPI001C1FD75B|nr:radical SAM protein [Paenibacillus oleatilyticus]MBU7318321.1 radical SAM protein [Paenibacillus oleatilyticus]
MLAAIWVTTSCNMACRYCYEGMAKPNKFMTLETADKTIEYLNWHLRKVGDNRLIINYHGGEPLMNYEVIRYMTNRLREYYRDDPSVKVMFGLTTNGLLLDREKIDFLSEFFDYSLSVSIDGTRESHDCNRVLLGGQGTYDLITAKISAFLRSRSDIRARITITTRTVGSLYDNVKHLIDLGFSIIVPYADLFDPRWDEQHMEVLNRELDKIAALLCDLRMRNKEVSVGLVHTIDWKKKGLCTGGTKTIHVDPEGHLFPCAYAVGRDRYWIGSVQIGIDRTRHKALCSQYVIKNEVCAGCTHYSECVGPRCKIINEVITGDPHLPSAVLCNIESIRHRIMRKYPELSQ